MVPSQLREAGLALGVPKWRVIMDIVLPSALAGIMTGVMVVLGAGGRGNGAAFIYGVWQPLLAAFLDAAYRGLAFAGF